MDSVDKFGRYTVVRLLGEGAMGKVYLANDPVLERKVALKVISMDSMMDSTMREDFLKRFSFEAKASAKLSHPSIVAVYDAAKSGLLRVESANGGKKILAKELPAILDDISRQFKNGPAPSELVDIVRYVLLAGKHPVVRSWARSPSYWLRFNGVKILELSGVDIDTSWIK